MAVRGLEVSGTDQFSGLDTFSDKQSLGIDSFSNCLNVVILANGNVSAIRNPFNFHTALNTGNMVLSASFYDRQAGGVILYDIQTTASTLTTYYTTGSGSTTLGAFSTIKRWWSLNVNNNIFRVNQDGSQFIQYTTALLTTPYNVGIGAPSAAPSIATSTGGGTVTLAAGATASYAYRNSTTGHISLVSSVSLSSGMVTNGVLKVGVVSTTAVGVDGIVLFLSQDGGSVRFLQIDASGNTVVNANSTSTIGISSPYLLNQNVQETINNYPPPSGINYIFRWKNRIMGCGFSAAGTRNQAVYSGFDQIAAGIPWEAWPALNIITIPNKGEALQCGIDTPVGALMLTNRDAYLLRGNPTDKVVSGTNTIQFSEQLQQLGWGLGTRSPLTLQSTPFGVIWLDQDKHLQLWSGQGDATEIAMNLRSDLATILDTDSARQMAEARWFQTGDQAGFYVLTASVSDSINNRTWIVTMVKRGESQAASFTGGAGGALKIGATVSDQTFQCLEVSRISGSIPQLFLLGGGTDVLKVLLQFNPPGGAVAGPWAAASIPFFEIITGNQMPFFNRLHSIRWTGTNNTLVQVRNLDDSDIETLNPETDDEDNFALINRYGVRQKLRFYFPGDDADQYLIRNIYIAMGKKQRVI